MPAQEEVDEINEFLQKRREKQRLGELPRNDFTPGFAKKISLAVFGKPRVEKVPLQSTQPTVASTQAQAAMRQQLDEIMDTHLATTSRPSPTAPLKNVYPTTSKSAFASPSLPQAPNRTPASTPTTSSPAPPAPRVPHYYSNMPYPPYIQRGLATLPKPSPTAAQAAAPPRAPPVSSTPLPSNKPLAPPISSPRQAAPPSSPAPRVTPILPPGERTIPTARMLTQTPAPAQRLPAQPSPAPTLAAKPSAPKQSFWKKIFGEKQTPPTAPVISPSPIKSTAPSPYAMAARNPAVANTRASIEPIAPIAPIPRAASTVSPSSEKTSDISPVKTTQTPPSIARVDIATIAREKTNVPALTQPVPAVIHEKKSIYPTAPFPMNTAREPIETKKEFTPAPRVNTPLPTAEKNPIISTPSPATIPARVSEPSPTAKSAPYVPPWVARTTPQTQSPSSSVSDAMPWKQPFGTHSTDDSSHSRENSIATIDTAARPVLPEKKIRASIDEELKVEDADAYTAPSAPAHSSGMESAMEQEISEEEALESLPFEDVEGLSASDLDYLSQKEKEHRKAQEEKDNDVGIPSELKNTLQRQSTQLEGALTTSPQTSKTPTNDEKQEILRRLKQMMEEDGHPQ